MLVIIQIKKVVLHYATSIHLERFCFLMIVRLRTTDLDNIFSRLKCHFHYKTTVKLYFNTKFFLTLLFLASVYFSIIFALEQFVKSRTYVSVKLSNITWNLKCYCDTSCNLSFATISYLINSLILANSSPKLWYMLLYVI